MDFKLRYLIEADGRKAINELQDVDRQLDKLGGSMRSTFGADAANLIGTTAVALTAVGAAAIGATRQLFELSKQAAEYGSTIFDASEKTGLHAETLSAMDFAAKQSGTSLESITGGIAKYSKAVSKASKDTDDATQFLKDFGFKPQEAINDLDGSLAKVFKRIIDAKPGVEQMTLAQKAFGKSGADLLPFIKSFNGDLTELTRRAKELGVTINDETAAAADAFGDQLDTLNAQFDAIGRTIGTAFMPTFMDMAQATSEWAVRNKGEIESWAAASADAFSATGSLLGDFIEKVSDATTELLKFKAIQQLVDLRNYIATDLDPVGAAAKAAFLEAERLRLMRPDVGDPYLPGGKRGKDPGSGPGVDVSDSKTKVRSGDSRTDKQVYQDFVKELGKLGVTINSGFRTYAQQAALYARLPKGEAAAPGTSDHEFYRGLDLPAGVSDEVVRKAAAAAGVTLGKPRIHQGTGLHRHQPFHKGRGDGGGEADIAAELSKENQETLAATKEGLDQELAQRAATDSIKRQQIEALESFEVITHRQANDELMKLDEDYLQFKLQKLHEEMTAAVGNTKEEARITQEIFLVNQQVEETAALNKAKRRKEELEEFEKSMEVQSRAMVKANEQERERLDLIKQQNEERKKAFENAFPVGPNPDSAPAVPGSGLINLKGSLLDAIGLDADLEDNVTNRTQIISDAFTKMGGMVGDAVGNMAQGLGSMVEQWVLYGSAGPDALKKMTAAVLANLAAQATVEAIMELARGFAALASPFTAWQAPLHFKSAALFGAVAATSALAGRAIAGDSFSGGSARGGSRGPQDQPEAQQQQDRDDFRTYNGQYGSSGEPYFVRLGRELSERQNLINGHLHETIDELKNKITSMPAHDVVAIASETSKGQDAMAHGSQRSYSRGGRAPEQFRRSIGRTRS